MLINTLLFALIVLGIAAFCWWMILEAGDATRGRRRIAVGIAFVSLALVVSLLSFGWLIMAGFERDGHIGNAYRMRLLLEAGRVDEVSAALVTYQRDLEAGATAYEAGVSLHLTLYELCQRHQINQQATAP